MLETWLENTKANRAVWGGKIRRLARMTPVGVGMMSLAFLLAGARPFWNYIHRPAGARLDAIAEEVGDIAFMIQGIRARWLEAETPLINHAGTKVMYCQTSENGAAVITTDLVTGQRKQVFEELAAHFIAGPGTLLAPYSWSPDDTKIIYSRQLQNPVSRADPCGLVVADADTGRELAVLEMPGVRKTVWLTPKSFVCIARAGDIHLIIEQPAGNWQEADTISITASGSAPGRLPLLQDQPDGRRRAAGTIPVNGRYDGLTALSSNTLVWQETNQILTFDLSAKAVVVRFQLEGWQLKGFSCSLETGQLLLTCTEAGRDSLWRLMPGEQLLQATNCLASVKAEVSLWLNGGKGYVALNQNKQLRVQTGDSAEAIRVLEPGRIASFAGTPDGKHLVIFGTASNEPASGVWAYDLAANTARCLAPAAGHGLQHVDTRMKAQHRLIPVPGRWFDLNVYKPIPFDRHRKYPVVVANTPVSGAQPYLGQYALAVVNAGAYFVVLDRRDWSVTNGTGAAWVENEAQVINLLRQEPTIDPGRITLISNCAESGWLKRVATNQPWRCQGMFLLIGNELPDPVNLAAGRYPPKIFDSACDAWEGNGDRLKKYQATGAQSGVAVDYLIHPNTKHDFISMQSQRDRIRALLHFVFDN